MSKLEELRKKLYEKEEAPKREDESSPRIFFPDATPPIAWKEDAPPRVQEGGVNPMTKYRKTIIASFLIMVALTLAGSLFFIFYQLRFGESGVSVRIFGNEEAAAGSTEQWQVEVRNQSGVLAKDIELIFNFPEGSVPLSDDEAVARSGRARLVFGELPAGESIQAEFSARLFGKSAEEKLARATVVYRRENLTSRLNEVAEFVTRISRIPLVISVVLPPDVSPDQQVDARVSISSDALSSFENLAIRVEYPEGFSFRESDPKPREENSLWNIASLKPGESFSIKISGTLIGDPADVKIFSVGAGEYNTETKEWRPLLESLGETHITSPPLFVRTEINGSRKSVVRAGEEINVMIKYKNSSDQTLRDVFVETRLSENLVDLKTLVVKDGFFDGALRRIVWNSASVSALKDLAPGAEGELSFKVAVRGTLPIIDTSSKNFILSVRSLIDTLVIPGAFAGKKLSFEDSFTAKVASDISLGAEGLFFHPVIQNSGLLPPRVKQATEYAIVWKLGTLANDMRDVKVVGLLPGNVRWTNQVLGDFQDKLHFNPSSGEVIWEPGTILSGTGVIRPSAIVAFQVSVTPGEDVLRKSAELVRGIRFFGRDSFTDLRVEGGAKDITTEISGDAKTTREQWYVAP